MALEVTIGANIESLKRGLKAAGDQLNKFEGTAGKAANGITNAFTGLGGKLAGIASTGAIISLGRQVLNTTAEFEKFGAVLSNTLGSTALSNLKLKEIQDFAAKTPYGVQELTGAFVKLANQGFKPTGDQMRKLGDLAASTGKTFDQLAEAILDGQVGEYERLKEFGIRAKDAGDKVIFTFKGVQTTVEKSSGAIREYITSLGDAEGVSGSMAKISETLTGKISNLGDKWDQMLVSIGGNTTGVFSLAMTEIGNAIDKITQYNKQLELASKYKLTGSNFGQELNRALNPFSNKGATDVEKQVAGITIAQEETTKFVSSAIVGAKTAADFGKAIAKLAQMGKEYANLHLGEEGFKKGEQKAIIDQYQQGVKALQDARAKFLEEASKGHDASFGKTKEKKTPADVLQQLGYEIETIKQTAGIMGDTFGKTLQDKISAYSKAISGVIGLGVDGNSPLVQGLKAQASALKDPVEDIKVQFKGASDVIASSFDTMNGVTTAGLMEAAVAVSTAGALMTSSIEKVNTANLIPFSKAIADGNSLISIGTNGLMNTLSQFTTELNYLVQDGVANTFGQFGLVIGEALASGSNAFDSVGTVLLSSLASFLRELGTMLVSYGTAALIKAKLDAAMLIPGAGFVIGPQAIAAGVALMAISGAIGRFAASAGSKGASSGSSGKPSFSSSPMPSNYQPSASYSSNSHTASGSPGGAGGVIRLELDGLKAVALINRAGYQLSRYK